MRFPVLCIPRDTGVFLATKAEEVATTRASGEWTVRAITGMKMVDADEACFVVRSFTEAKTRAPALRKLAQLLNLKRELELDIAPTAPISVLEVKAAVLRSIDDDPEGFEELSGMDIDWWHSELSRASSLREVLAAFAKAAGAA